MDKITSLKTSILTNTTLKIYLHTYILSVNKLANPILFADDTTIIISNANPDEFQKNINSVMTEITSWFQSNLLSLNYNKTHFMQFQSKKQNEGKIQILVPNLINSNINSTKLLGLMYIQFIIMEGPHYCSNI